MTEYQKRDHFYQQFNTVLKNWHEWTKTPQGLVEILKHPWKSEPPEVTIRANDPENNKARDILNQIRARHTTAGTYTPPGGTP